MRSPLRLSTAANLLVKGWNQQKSFLRDIGDKLAIRIGFDGLDVPVRKENIVEAAMNGASAEMRTGRQDPFP